jgi:hypothetical protein
MRGDPQRPSSRSFLVQEPREVLPSLVPWCSHLGDLWSHAVGGTTKLWRDWHSGKGAEPSRETSVLSHGAAAVCSPGATPQVSLSSGPVSSLLSQALLPHAVLRGALGLPQKTRPSRELLTTGRWFPASSLQSLLYFGSAKKHVDYRPAALVSLGSW